MVRLRLRPRPPRSAAARRPAGRVHPAERRGARRRPGRARPAPRQPRRAPDRPPRPGAATRSSPWRASSTCRRSTPTTTTTRTPWRATPRSAAPSPAAASPCTPRRTTWCSSAARSSPAAARPTACSRPTGRAWLKKLDAFYLKAYPVERYAAGLAPLPAGLEAGRADAGRARLRPHQPGKPEGPRRQRRRRGAARRLPRPHRRLRHAPATTRPSRARATSACTCASARSRSAGWRAKPPSRPASDGARVWLSELVWRDFYQQILHHLPHVVGHSCKPEYDRVRFEHGRHADEHFAAWCEGRTGYPLVDAAMAQINQTGWMHNRLRMVAASFLVKDLGIDWRRGEALLRRAPDRLRAGVEQRRLAVGGVDRLRRPAVVPDLQSGDPEPPVRPAGPLHPPLPAAARPPRRRCRSTRPGSSGRSSSRRRAWRWATTTRGRSSTTPRRGRRRSPRYAVVRNEA